MTSARTRAGRLPGLDHLRAFAIAYVFVYHYRLFAKQPLVEAVGAFGWSGVDLFFVLSGFLIGTQLFEAHAARTRSQAGDSPAGRLYRRFFAKRVLRTLPPYLAVLLLYFAVPAFIERGALPPLWKLVTFTQNLSMVLWKETAFSHAWSLCVEEHFYLLLPLLCWCFLRPGRTRAGLYLLGVLFVAGPLLRAALWLLYVLPVDVAQEQTRNWYRLIYYPTWSRLDGLLLGVALAAFRVYRRAAAERLVAHSGALLALGVLLLAGAGFLCADQQTFFATVLGFPLLSLGYAAVLLSALDPRGLLGRVDSTATRLLAAISYSLYLTHKSVVHLTLRALEGRVDEEGLLAFAICCATSLLAGAALHLLVERPALRLRERWPQAPDQSAVADRAAA